MDLHYAAGGTAEEPPIGPVRLAGPWSRFFARVIDTVVLMGIIFVLAAIALRIVVPLEMHPKEKDLIYDISPFITILTAFLLHAVMIVLFGNSIGKAIFGIRAAALSDPQGWPTFTGTVARELRVLVLGLAFYIPVVSQVAMFIAWRTVRKRQPAFYDRGRAAVIDEAGSAKRRTIGMTIGIVIVALPTLAIGGFYFNDAINDRLIRFLIPGYMNKPDMEARNHRASGTSY